MSAFEDFVNLELPRRPAMLTQAVTGYDGDPNAGGAPAIVQNAPRGSFFLRETGSTLYKKNTSSPATWAAVGAGAEGTPSDLTWRVETTGNDTTGDGSVGAPFATVSGALARLRSLYGTRVRHRVDVVAGVGSFPGFHVTGFEYDPVDQSLPCGIRIYGTMVNATLSQGTATGTLTSTVTGQTSTDVVYTVIGDTGQNWAVDALKGFLVEILTGTSATFLVPILSNTANTITVARTTAFGSVGGTYAIRDWGTVINTTVPCQVSLPASNAVSQTPTPTQASIFVGANTGRATTSETRIENLKLTPNTANSLGLIVQGVPCTFTRGQIAGTSTSTKASLTGSPGTISFTDSVVTPAGSATAVTAVGGGGILSVSTCFIRPGGTGVSISGFGTVNVTTTRIEPNSFGIPISGQPVVNLSGTTVESTASQCIRCRVIEGNTGGAFIFATALKTIGPPASTALEIQGPAFANITTLVGSGALYGVALAQGGRVRITASSLWTATNEIILDDFNTPFTLAQLRALPSNVRVLSNSFGTAIWEG